ncbi:MAG: aldolase catalytic domain-containing protein [Flavobacteriia bacterium]|jgi:4-hydroxy 2-oxovalerate aldolase
MKANFKILDCTLRDGGYYTNWDFENSTVETYLTNLNSLPVDYLEVGYRNNPQSEYQGKYFYLPIFELENIRLKSNKKIVIILNEKDVASEEVKKLLTPCIGLVDMVRIALAPENLVRALKLAEELRKMSFEVGFNVMYMSKWKETPSFLANLSKLGDLADYFYMVDSYGGVYPNDVVETIELVRSETNVKLGFHGHNNLELALINSLTAVEHGVEMIDSTVLGMGRGAGNLKTELLLTVLSSKFGVEVDFNALGLLVQGFEELHKKHEWGTNLPYMISGSNSLPQKDVMDWVTARFYSLNSIVRALNNQSQGLQDNEKFANLKTEPAKNVLIIGGGPSAQIHSKAIEEFILKSDDIVVIHASSKNAKHFLHLDVPQYFCLVGNEGYRMEKVFEDISEFHGKCVLPPFPRKMGTYVPDQIKGKCFELEKVSFTDILNDSHTALALQTCLNLQPENIFLAGYDGYFGSELNVLDRLLTKENETLFSEFIEFTGLNLVSLCPTLYSSLNISSVYSQIHE